MTMTTELIMAKYGEIALKGLNKRVFEDILVKNIKKRLAVLGSFEIRHQQSTLYIKPITQNVDLDLAVKRLSTVFGIGAIQRSLIIEKDYEKIISEGIPYLKSSLLMAKTFKVEAKRSDKSFPLSSPELMRELGSKILEAYPHLTVDVHKPDVTVRIEIRDKGAYLNTDRIIGAGGIPVGSSGQVLALLSGGIDSPVAAYMMAKRGLRVDMVHFQSPPYTSERALMKVEALCEKLTSYLGDIRFYCVNFTEIQEKLREHCPEEYFTIIMRRLMVKIANKICEQNNYHGLVTGESVGQVASQTLMAINCTDAVAEYPVFRPVVGMDKIEITDISRKIDTFETSILPYEDCCTVFTPKHPKTRPTIKEAEWAEGIFDYEPLLQRALAEITVKDFSL